MQGTRGVLFGTQIAATLIMICWVTITSGILFAALKLMGILRVSAEVEELGADVSKHGGSAYPEQRTSSAMPAQQSVSADVGNVKC